MIVNYQTATRCDDLYNLFLDVVDVKDIVAQGPLHNALLPNFVNDRTITTLLNTLVFYGTNESIRNASRYGLSQMKDRK
jgi:hypothetical protein